MEYNKESSNKDRAYYKQIAKEYITPRYLELKDLDGEIWKSINGFTGYSVSNKGRIRSEGRMVSNGTGYHKSKPIILKPNVLAKGYFQVTLNSEVDKKSFQVHRLVALAFIPNPKAYNQINHINGIKADNRIENLEWCNNSMNQIHAYRIGLQKPHDAAGIRRRSIDFFKDGKLVYHFKRIVDAVHFFGDSNSANMIKVAQHKKHYLTYRGFKVKYGN